MSYVPTSHNSAPIWDSDTDEVVVVAEGTGVSTTVPPQCCYMVFSISDLTSGTQTVFISPDATDPNTGMVMENGAGGLRNFGVAVAAGTVIYLHTLASTQTVDVNILRFYRKP